MMALPGGEGGECMLAKVLTGAVVGMGGALVEVEVDIAQSGLPNFLIVGLPDTAVQEARERVRASIRNSGLSFPKMRRYLCCV
jgi:magnesium chelatase family protein